MANETSTSKDAFITKLHEAVRMVRERYGITIRFVEIHGKRWSFLAGAQDTLSSFLPPERIMLTDRYGVVSDQWSVLVSDERSELMEFLKKVIEPDG